MADPVRVLIELPYTPMMESHAFGAFVRPPAGPIDIVASIDMATVTGIAGLALDPAFPPVEVPNLHPRAEPEDPTDVGPLLEMSLEPTDSTYVVRGQTDESALEALEASVGANGGRVFSDPRISSFPICPGAPAQGTAADVERRLAVADLHARGMDGSGVLVAIVDTGINIPYLNMRGKHPRFDAARSWVPHSGLTPGAMPPDHGTMCAYDVCIAAPRCTLLDLPLLLSNRPGGTPMDGFLSDALLAFRHLLNIMMAPTRPGEGRSLVVNNSWGMFHPSWDFPVGHPGNYSDNANHPFNRIVTALDRAGADILFAAGNCGVDCPDGRCDGVTTKAIYGANSHPQVLCVGGVDLSKRRVGYSSRGPGRLTRRKPDIAGYTHFDGSGVYEADGGTSAACPVVAGVVAALRTRFRYDPLTPATHPAAVRDMMTKTAEDRGRPGFDFGYGWGIVSGQRLSQLGDLHQGEPAVDLSGIAGASTEGPNSDRQDQPVDPAMAEVR